MHNSAWQGALKCTRTYTSTLARQVLFCCLNFTNAVKNVSVSLIYLLWELLRKFIPKKFTLNTFWLYVFLCLTESFFALSARLWFLMMINEVPTNWLFFFTIYLILTGYWETISEIKKSEVKCLTLSIFEDMYGISWQGRTVKNVCV